MSGQNTGYLSSSCSSNESHTKSSHHIQTAWSSSQSQQNSNEDQNLRKPGSPNIWEREVENVFMDEIRKMSTQLAGF